MVSPERDIFAFDGSVAPWRMDVNDILQRYHAQGIEVIPFLYHIAEYAYGDWADRGNRRRYQPPADVNDYVQYVEQVVARFGHNPNPPVTPLTEDEAVGLGLLSIVELWNEPNLHDPNWGMWVGTLDEYWPMFRAGAEAVRRVDPEMKISHGGFAGVDLSYVAQLTDFQYPDGKRPIDFTDIINVHHYTGDVAPELSMRNTNIHRGREEVELRSFFQNMLTLDQWRRKEADNKPIWMTETGYDTGGPR